MENKHTQSSQNITPEQPSRWDAAVRPTRLRIPKSSETSRSRPAATDLVSRAAVAGVRHYQRR